LVIVVDSISFQLPITQLPISAAADTVLVRFGKALGLRVRGRQVLHIPVFDNVHDFAVEEKQEQTGQHVEDKE